MPRKLSKKQMKIARIAEPRDKITAADRDWETAERI